MTKVTDAFGNAIKGCRERAFAQNCSNITSGSDVEAAADALLQHAYK